MEIIINISESAFLSEKKPYQHIITKEIRYMSDEEWVLACYYSDRELDSLNLPQTTVLWISTEETIAMKVLYGNR